MQIKSAVRLVALSAFFMALVFAPEALADDKIRVDNLDDLPRFSYSVDGSVVGIITSDEAFEEFAAKVRSDIEGVLAKYEIGDATTLQGYYSVLSRLDLMGGDYESALARVEQIGALEEKEAGKLMNGLFTKAWIAAHGEVDPDADFEAFATAFASNFGEMTGVLPWDVVQDEIKSAKGRAEIYSENFILGMAQSRVDPAVTASGSVSSDLVSTVVSMRYILTTMLPLKNELIDAYGGIIAANKIDKPNIWYAREYILGADEGTRPITIGIWDSGTDTSVFEDQLWVNTAERADGEDRDGNGFIDDVNGIAYDKDGNRSPYLVHPLGDMADRVGDAMEYTKGFMDLTSAIDSEEASEIKRHLSTIEPDKVNDFIEEVNFAGLYMHGTHVAGIAVQDNPFARLMVARLSFDYHNPPSPLSVDIAKRLGGSYKSTIAYFRRHGVRVVNMSWGWSLKEIESILEANGVGETPEERAKLTREILDTISASLNQAMLQATNILFVTAAGNSDNDVEFDRMIPASYELPNLLVVGAVDQAGDPTGFTSQGENVRLFAIGFEVESYVPGGEKMAMSGTSMSSPAVVNLAAKILAVEPYLTPQEVIDLITEGATPREGDKDFLLLHPKNTMNSLEVKQKDNTLKRALQPDPARAYVD